jgi:transposase-like protein
MQRTRPPYSPEFRRQAVELIRSRTPLKQVAGELGVCEQTEGGRGRLTATPRVGRCVRPADAASPAPNAGLARPSPSRYQPARWR